MIIKTKNNKQVVFRRLNIADLDLLYVYLLNLSNISKKRFGPHPFDKHAIFEFYHNSDLHIGYVGIDLITNEIIAYSIIKKGYLEHDNFRLQSYGLTLNNTTDCTFAPSVADNWQNYGIGYNMFSFILSDLKNTEIKRIILWGGVQKDNQTAINYYLRNNFKILGQFTYNGENYDMLFDIQ